VNNDHCNKLLSTWYDEQCYESLHKLLHLIMGVAATVGCKRVSDRQDIDDVAQLAATEVWELLEHRTTITAWESTVSLIADKHALRIQRANQRQNDTKETIKEIGMKEEPSESAKEILRDIAENGLLPREWQVIHGIYWNKKKQRELATALDTTQQNIDVMHRRALDNMRQALHRYGVYKDNCLAWYYGKAKLTP